MERGFVRLLVLLTIALLGSLSLEIALRSHYVLELYVLFIGVVLSVIVVSAVAYDKMWGWPLASIAFSFFMLNALVVYLNTRAQTLSFEIVLVACLIGLFMAFSRVDARVKDPLASLPQMDFSSPDVAGKN
ncbi:MAG: hypothetical protein AABY13_03640 [Nanoarchaeota archaeon]